MMIENEENIDTQLIMELPPGYDTVLEVDSTLPIPQSNFASHIIKDPYNFNFLDLGLDAKERELEGAL